MVILLNSHSELTPEIGVSLAGYMSNNKTKIGIKNSIISKTMHDVDNETTLVLETGDYNNFIVHKTGHGLGLDVHEDPYIVRGNNSPLEIGMIITVEPGLYLPGKFGIRIEDDVVITDKDPNVLTSFSKDLRIINNE